LAGVAITDKNIYNSHFCQVCEDFNMIIAQLSISPIGENVSLSKFVKTAIDVIKKHNVKFETNAMATVIETKSLDELFSIVSDAHKSVAKMGVKRIITELKIDDRGDKNSTMDSKVKAVLE
jgi:uncharacterized protein (TIGR00106 family)